MISLCWLRLASDAVVVCFAGFASFILFTFYLVVVLVLYVIILCAVLFFCVAAVFFDSIITKLVLHFFCLLQFCNLYSFLVCLVRNCLFTSVLVFLVFHLTYAIPYLPYFVQCFCALLT